MNKEKTGKSTIAMSLAAEHVTGRMSMKGFYEHRPAGSMFRGNYWNCRMSNGAVFSLWTPYKLTDRKEINNALLDFANSDMKTYDRKDIVATWETINPAKE